MLAATQQSFFMSVMDFKHDWLVISIHHHVPDKMVLSFLDLNPEQELVCNPQQ